MKKGTLALSLVIIFGISLLSWMGVRTYKWLTFYNEVGCYVENMYAAPTLEEVSQNLQIAITAIEENGLTQGTVSIFPAIRRNEKRNMGTWYQNLKKSQAVLEQAKQMNLADQSAILDDQRTCIMQAEKVFRYTQGISIYPYNGIFFWWATISFIGLVVSIIWGSYLMDYEKTKEYLHSRKK